MLWFRISWYVHSTPPQSNSVVGELISQEKICNFCDKVWRKLGSFTLNCHISSVEDLFLHLYTEL